MADQSVRITNLPDAATRESVAYDLWNSIRSNLSKKEGAERIDQLLALYAECRKATYGDAHSVDKLT